MANSKPKTEHLEKTRWQAGQSGNPSGKPKGTVSLKTQLVKALSDEEVRASVVAAMIKHAKKGNAGMMKLLWDRVDGADADAVLEAQVIFLPKRMKRT